MPVPRNGRAAATVSVIETMTVRALTLSGMELPRGLTLGEWENVGLQLKAVSESSPWWLADWLLFGEANYAGHYRYVVERTRLDYQTLRNYAWVARRFPPGRRRAGVSFAHHAEVARLPEPEQDYWLRRAEELEWSRNRLRRELRISLAERAPAPDPDPEVAAGVSVIAVRLDPERLGRCVRAAFSCGRTLDEWAAEVLEAAAAGVTPS